MMIVSNYTLGSLINKGKIDLINYLEKVILGIHRRVKVA